MSQPSNYEGSSPSLVLPANGQQSESDEHAHVDTTYYKTLFQKLWPDVTSDNRLSLFGFRRYRTTHLFNLRLLEADCNER